MRSAIRENEGCVVVVLASLNGTVRDSVEDLPANTAFEGHVGCPNARVAPELLRHELVDMRPIVVRCSVDSGRSV
jgi:hypothetical protein